MIEPPLFTTLDGVEYVRKDFADSERRKLQEENEKLHNGIPVNRTPREYCPWSSTHEHVWVEGKCRLCELPKEE